MDRTSALKIMQSAAFKELQHERRKIVIPLTLLILVTYFGFILTIAFAPALLGTTIGDGITSLGIYAGLGLLILSFAIVGIYIRLARGKIKTLLVQIRSQANQGK